MAIVLRILSAFVVACLLAGPFALAQQGGATRYVYDDNGRLRAVIAPNGEANIYEYDPAGNITAIRRNAAGTLEILDFSPREGVPGTQVKIVGTGLGGGVSAVTFNGAAAQIVSANAPVVVVTVPSGATTGPIHVATSGGGAMTAQPFIVRGISVSPSAITVLSEETVQFSAAIFVSGDQAVIWSVDGLEGGNSAVGTVSVAGLYTAPRLFPDQPTRIFRVRATSASEGGVYGEALANVKNREFIRPAFAQGVVVRNGSPPNVTMIHGGGVSVRNGILSNNSLIHFGGVSVRNGNPSNTTPIHSVGVSVRNGNPSNTTSIHSVGVAVRNGNPSNAASIYGVGVAVRNGNPSNAALISSGPVSVTAGPAISAIAPVQISRGTAVNITISGSNLTGAVSVGLLVIASAAIDTNIAVSNINVNGAGNSLTATLTISGAAAPGRRVVIVTTSGGSSPMTDVGSNTIEIIL
ncbi:MAG: IPT/TIG domain-containing protein [Blastocatellia bacterium]